MHSVCDAPPFSTSFLPHEMHPAINGPSQTSLIIDGCTCLTAAGEVNDRRTKCPENPSQPPPPWGLCPNIPSPTSLQHSAPSPAPNRTTWFVVFGFPLKSGRGPPESHRAPMSLQSPPSCSTPRPPSLPPPARIWTPP